MDSEKLVEAERLQRHRERQEAFRERRRRGALLVPIEIERSTLAALERLALLDQGERDPRAVATAVVRFLAAAGPVAGLGDALYPPADC